jgi:hypothetical protein
MSNQGSDIQHWKIRYGLMGCHGAIHVALHQLIYCHAQF